ncbi:hypothetical protein GCM10009555_058710 [Acrocarpospora macrocephala]|uniref:Right handed beta helix domain-containing protein n=1 Tax=Acrocarpospora macrocephala TaxID=150177 RepID=A0A5M3WSP5_9ACTN|nr:hypothetical protein [Acrocarpospora macrocephala]GES11904.1 hypothetical protein Amac_055010 [Acrocarpospora macrocephala]
MNKIKLALTGTVLGTVVGGLAVATPAFAEERTCRGTIRATTLDNIRVPAGATCTLLGTRVKGTIKVERNATLVARKVNVEGNVQAEGARAVSVVAGSIVRGSVQVKQGGAATVTSSRINADIQLDANRRYLRVNNNRVGGSIQVVGNHHGAQIHRNSVKGNLQCKENHPKPTGSSNAVGGNKEDQCRGF